jgi:hypothetical protein
MAIRSLDSTPTKSILGRENFGLGMGGAGGGAGRGGVSKYHYGWPSGGTLEPNVACQFLFDEAANNIVDEVAGVTCVKAGTPTYSQTGTGAWSAFSGIKFNANGDYFLKNSATAEMALGTAEFTIEWVQRISTTKQFTEVAWNYTGAGHGYALALTNTDKGYFYFEDAAGLALTAWQPTISPTIFDGVEHKHRLYSTNRGLATCGLTYKIDGTTMQASASLWNDTGGKNIPCGQVEFGWNTHPCDGIMREFRLSNNNTNNSGGPGGG